MGSTDPSDGSARARLMPHVLAAGVALAAHVCATQLRLEGWTLGMSLSVGAIPPGAVTSFAVSVVVGTIGIGFLGARLSSAGPPVVAGWGLIVGVIATAMSLVIVASLAVTVGPAALARGSGYPLALAIPGLALSAMLAVLIAVLVGRSRTSGRLARPAVPR